MMRGSPEPSAVMDIVVWLRSLGLGKYEAIFRDNEIDEPVLPNLTVNDLKELGVTATAASCWMPSLFCDEGGEAPSVEWQPGGGRRRARNTTPHKRPHERGRASCMRDMAVRRS
jgi:hypothetical protein